MAEKKSFEDFFYSVPDSDKSNFDINNVFTAYGDWSKLEGANIIIKRIISQLLIIKGTYPFDPLFGENLLQFLYEPFDEITMDKIKDVVGEVVQQNRGKEKITYEVLKYSTGKGFRINIIIDMNGKKVKYPVDIDERLLRDEVER